MTTKQYYVPGDFSTLDYPIRPLVWYVFVKAWRRWVYLSVVIASLVLEWRGVIPPWTTILINIASWSFVVWQINDIFYQRSEHKRKMLILTQRHETRMIQYARRAAEYAAHATEHAALKQRQRAQWHADVERFRKELS